jgi:hypothetical protein
LKDENKQTVLLSTPVLFDHQLIDRITFDLVHINQGWDSTTHDYAYRNRSFYKSSDIIDFFEQFRFFTVEWTIGINKEEKTIKGKRYFRYHWETTDEQGEFVRLVLDIPRKFTGEGVLITVFKP